MEHIAAIGIEKSTIRTRAITEEKSFPDIISKGVRRVTKRLEKVFPSFSEVIDAAEKAGTINSIRVRFMLKNIENICLPPAEATEWTPLVGHKANKARDRRTRYAAIIMLFFVERDMPLNSRLNIGFPSGNI
jgi:hypothetical protein